MQPAHQADCRTARSSNPVVRVPERRLITLPTLRRGYTLEVTPVPIPNTAVKLQRADDTASDRGGKVGRRDVKIESPQFKAGGFLRF